jgi:hypothetical protein
MLKIEEFLQEICVKGMGIIKDGKHVRGKEGKLKSSSIGFIS